MCQVSSMFPDWLLFADIVDPSFTSYSTRAVLDDFEKDGVVYLELRTTPRTISEQTLTKDGYVQTILSIIQSYNERPSGQMRTYLILSIDRRNSLAEVEEVVDLAIKYQSSGVVGVDLCGNPAHPGIDKFGPAFARARAAGLKVTLHFAETPASATDEELWTLLSWKPDRLGHVIHVKPEIKAEIEKQNIGVELCLSCNVHAKLITGSYSNHHFGWWKDSKVEVALSVGSENLSYLSQSAD